MTANSKKEPLNSAKDPASRKSSQGNASGHEDRVSAATINRLEKMIGGAADAPPDSPALARQKAAEDASAQEQEDALRVNLMQDTPDRNTRDSTGKLVDDLARERMAGLTEAGSGLEDKGVTSVVPGRDDPSRILRSHHPNTEVARAQDVVEGNLDEPRDEARTGRKVDDGTAA